MAGGWATLPWGWPDCCSSQSQELRTWTLSYQCQRCGNGDGGPGLLLAILVHRLAARPGPPGPIQAHLDDILL